MAGRVTRSNAKRAATVKKQQKLDDEEEEEESEEELPKKKPTTAPAKKKAKLAAKQQEDEEDEEEEAAPKPVKKSRVTNSKHAPPVDLEDRVAGDVDAEFTQSGNAKVSLCATSNLPLDAYLVLVEGTSDKYYILQVIEDAGRFTCFSRWGRTGTKGQQQRAGPVAKLTDAQAEFEKKFLDKTGNTWAAFTKGAFKPKAKKYDCLLEPVAAGVRAARASGVNWEYQVTDNVAGKQNGWYSYDAANADEVEAVYQSWLGKSSLAMRVITSESSGYVYNVDMAKLMQTNASTGKQRAIRRVNPNNYQPAKSKPGSSRARAAPPRLTVEEVEALLPVSRGEERATFKLSDVDGKTAEEIERFAEMTMGQFPDAECLFRGAFAYENPTLSPPPQGGNPHVQLLWVGLKTMEEVSNALHSGQLPRVPHGRAGSGAIYCSYTQYQAFSKVRVDAKNNGAVGFLLLAEVFPGQEFVTTQDYTGSAPPAGFDSVRLQGRLEPNGGASTVAGVSAPVAKPTPTAAKTSSFSETEIALYRAEQARIRFLVAFDWPKEIELAKPPAEVSVSATASFLPQQQEEEEGEEYYEEEEEEEDE